MLKISLVGCGRISYKHAEVLNNKKINEIKLVSVCDIKIERAKKIGKKYNISYYSDMHKMVRETNPDIISVLTESGNHSKHIIELSKYGKALIVEKPMALNVEQAEKMILECEKNNCILFVVKQNRFNIGVSKLKELIKEGKLGKLFLSTVRVRWSRDQEYYDQDSWRGTWKLDGGVVTNQASHHIDLLEWMMGGVKSVYAKSINALAKTEAEDTAVVILKFINGGLGIIEATTATRPEDLEGSLSILGEKGTVVIGGFAVNKVITWKIQGIEEINNNLLNENPQNVYGFGHLKFYMHVLDVLKGKEKNMLDGRSGKKVVEIINAIYESIETNREVYIGAKILKSKLGGKK